MSYCLGIEIGGTKLQVGVGLQNDALLSMARTTIDPAQGGEGIRATIPFLIDKALEEASTSLEDIAAIGIGFGGPVDAKTGVTLCSHQLEGWDGFPLAQWLADQLGKPVCIQNDASIAGYAEARLGAGKDCSRVFYLTIGSGIGGGWIVDGRIDMGQGLGATEIGHTWVPDPQTGDPELLEHLASGWAIGERARDAIRQGEPSVLKKRAEGNLDSIDAKMVYQAAEEDDLLAMAMLEEATSALAIAVGNAITLLHPDVVVLGGGVSLMGERFWNPVREKIHTMSFPLFRDTVKILPAALQEDVVVVGAVLHAGEQVS